MQPGDSSPDSNSIEDRVGELERWLQVLVSHAQLSDALTSTREELVAALAEVQSRFDHLLGQVAVMRHQLRCLCSPLSSPDPRTPTSRSHTFLCTPWIDDSLLGLLALPMPLHRNL